MNPEGKAPDDVEFEEREGFLEARFLGLFNVARFKRQLDAAVDACRKTNHTLLLIDATRLQGKVTTVDRFEIGTYGARVALHLKVAVFGSTPFLEPGKFGAQVAQNRGLRADTFTDRQKAVDWLLASP